MLITLSGDSYGFFDNAFYNSDTEDFDVDLVSANSSRVVIENPSTGAVTAFVGSGLVASNDDDDIRGTLSALEFYDADGDLVVTMTGISWELRDLIIALDDALTDGDDDALMALVGQNGEVTVDATAATGETDLYLDNLDVPVTFIGGGADDEVATGDGSDLIETGDGDDYIDPGDNYGEDTVDPGLGDDTIDAFSMDDGYLYIDHADMVLSGHGMRFGIDGHANTALITKTGGNGTTTIYDVVTAMEADGLALSGTASDDTFNATVSNDGWLALTGGRGDDSFVLGESDGTVRLDYKTDNSGNTPTRGININMSTGIVWQDGFGGRDTITTAAPYTDEETGELYFLGEIEIRGTAHADTMMGSARDERFVTLGGNDMVSGEGGWDMLRFDQSGMTGAVAVDLAAGTAKGSWQGTDFRQTISGIEELRGTREFGDKLSGSDASESFFGRGGNDAIFGDGFDPTYAMDEAASVYRLYQATLDRAPDITGFSNWSGQLAGGRALDAVINGFVDSAEFQATYGALDDTAFVELLYQNVLDREADAGGLRVWTQQLAAGTSRAEVVRGFSQSAEFVAATAEDFKDWMRGLEHDAGDPYHDWLSGETGDNALAGGLFADVFDFEQEDGGSHLVLDLEAWDYISLGGFDYGSASAALNHMSQSGSDVLFSDQGVEITFQNTQIADITDDMIMV